MALAQSMAFEAVLRNTPMGGLINERLMQMADEASEQYIGALFNEERTSEEARQAVLDVGLIAMAQDGIVRDSREHPFSMFRPPRWINLARLNILEYSLDLPDEQIKKVQRSIYFSKDRELLRGIGRIVSASVVPGGAYLDYEFALGVAAGDITSK